MPDGYGESDSFNDECDGTNSLDEKQQIMAVVCGGRITGSGKRTG